MSRYELHVVLDNETENMRFYNEIEEIDRWMLRDDGTPDIGKIFRLMREEYGRCQSSIYIDTLSEGRKRVGWYFQKRLYYSDREGWGHPMTDRNSYIRGAWVTIHEEVKPAVDREVRYLALR